MTEIEIKYDFNKLWDFHNKLKSFYLNGTYEGCVCKIIDYYDDEEDSLLKRGHTFRRVSGFNNNKCRYDLKKGEVNTKFRTEESGWADLESDLRSVSGTFGIYKKLIKVASTVNVTETWLYESSNSVIIVTSDTIMDTNRKVLFKEIEFEHKSGDIEIIWEIKEALKKGGINVIPMQKYQKIRSIIGAKNARKKS